MSHDFFRNRRALGSVPQLPAIAGFLSKLLTFDVATDLTANFTQTRGTGASQTVTGGVVQFRNANYDQGNYITTNFTITKLLNFFVRHSWWRGGSASQESYNISMNVLNASNAVVTTFELNASYTHSYNDGSSQYYNAGYVYWRLGTDPASNTAKRLCGIPSTGVQHKHELVDVGGGYIQYKLDDVSQGAPFYLGNADYKLGGAINFSPLGGWYNNSIYDDLDTFSINYV